MTALWGEDFCRSGWSNEVPRSSASGLFLALLGLMTMMARRALGRSAIGLVAGGVAALLVGCGGETDGSDKAMTSSEQPEKRYADASEVPGAVVIRPKRNPDMVYDPETKRVTDTVTGESFGLRQEMRSGGICAAGIKAADGSPVYEFELKYGAARNPDRSIKRVVWQVFWARRGGWLERFRGKGAKEVKAFELAQSEAQNDSLERLGEFLRAERRGVMLEAKRRGMKVDMANDAVVVVDRRMDDTRYEGFF